MNRPATRWCLLAEADVTLERVQHEFIAETPARAPPSSSTLSSVPQCSASTDSHSPHAIDPTIDLYPVISDHRLLSELHQNARKVRI